MATVILKPLQVKDKDGVEIPEIEFFNALGTYIKIKVRKTGTSSWLNGWALIDTGAVKCSLDQHVLDNLKIEAHPEKRDTETAVGMGKEFVYSYDYTIPELGIQQQIIEAQPANILKKLSPELGYILGVVGRDILEKCILIYDGKNHQVTLEYNP